MKVHFLIAVIGGKGGVGKSVFAANLAHAFLKEMKAKTLLIDCDPKSCGDQNFITGIRPQQDRDGSRRVYRRHHGRSRCNTSSRRIRAGLAFIGAVQGPDQVFSVQVDLLA